MNSLNIILEKINSHPELISFAEIIDFINCNYYYTATTFTNGAGDELIRNKAGENEGSCKLFSFAKKQALTEAETLHCFGSFYRDDVLLHPDGSDHANIRTFMKYGWQYIVFENEALVEKI